MEWIPKHNIEYPIEELDLGEDATIIDVMEWMINTQLGRRNLPPAQRLAVMDKFKKKIQEEAKANMSIGGSADKKGSPFGETLIKKQTHTDKGIAKESRCRCWNSCRIFLKQISVSVEMSVDQRRK